MSHFIEAGEEKDDKGKEEDVVIGRQHGFAAHRGGIVPADKGEKCGHQGRPADEGDVRLRKDFPVDESPLGPIQENSAEDVKKRGADKTAGQDEDLPAPDLRIPDHRRDEGIQE